MTEKEKGVLYAELWELVARNTRVTSFSLKISQRMLKCVAKDEPGELTPDKHKVIEEMKLEWDLVKTIRADLSDIAAEMGAEEHVPDPVHLVICDELWDTVETGCSDALFKMTDQIADYQEKLNTCAFKLQNALTAETEGDGENGL